MKFLKGCGLAIAIALALAVGAGILSSIFTEPPTPEELARRDSLRAAADSMEARNEAMRDSIAAAEQARQDSLEWEELMMSIAGWDTFNLIDDWGETTGNGAKSQAVTPVTRMDFPYHDTEATLFVSCQSAWIRFTKGPNLTGGDIEDGYTVYRIRVRIDGKDATWRVSHNWNSEDVSLPYIARNALAGGETFEALLPWYGNGNVRFSWLLYRSSEAIAQTCD